MKCFRCRTGRILKCSIILIFVFLFINAAFFTYKCCRGNYPRTFEREINNNSSIPQTKITHPASDLIKYRNKYWQFHSSGCPDDDARKFEDCFFKNKNKNTYEEVVVYSSFYDDRVTPVSTRWVHILGVIKIIPKPSPLFCQIWLKGNDTSMTDKIIVTTNTSKTKKTSKNVEIKRGKFYGNPDQLSWVAEFPVVSYTTGRNHHFKGVSYGQRHFSCPLADIPLSLVPTHSSLTFKRDQKSSIFLPVQFPADKKLTKNDQQSYEHEFVVCVTQAYNKINPTELMEWIELHRMLGVTMINIYNGTVLPDDRLDSLLKYYTELGLLSVHQIPPSVVESSNAVEATKLSSPASLNDCMMRHLKSSRWVIVVDFDEVILPLGVRDYHALMKQVREIEKRKLSTTTTKTTKTTSTTTRKVNENKVKSTSKVTVSHSNLVSFAGSTDKKSSINNIVTTIKRSSPIKTSIIDDVSRSSIDDGWLHHTYMFRMAYFFRNVNESMIRNDSLFTSKYRWRTEPLESTSSPKSFIDPRKCLSVFNHFCYLTWAGQPQKKFVVDPEVAMVRHYRQSCSLTANKCNKLKMENILDQNMARFEDQLKLRMKKVQEDIFKLYFS